MIDKVRVGVVGTSWWADLVHLPSLKSEPRAEVVAICGRTLARAIEMAGKYEISRVFTDYLEMIKQANLDALIILTPDDTHFPITMSALDAGLHVMCEKPLALNATHAREMYKRAEAVGVKHMVFFTSRWTPPERYLRELIQEGYIGRCYHCDLRLLVGFGRDNEYAWRFDRRRANGMLADLGSHMIDLARWYVGEIARVNCNLATFYERQGVEDKALDPANDSAMLTLQFANGAQGTIYVSAVSHVAERAVQYHVSLHGEAGTLEADFSFAGVDIRGVRSSDEKFQSLTVPDRLRGDADKGSRLDVFVKQPTGDREFIHAILDDRPISPNFYDGWKAQQVIDAAIESNQNGCWVSIQ